MCIRSAPCSLLSTATDGAKDRSFTKASSAPIRNGRAAHERRRSSTAAPVSEPRPRLQAPERPQPADESKRQQTAGDAANVQTSSEGAPRRPARPPAGTVGGLFRHRRHRPYKTGTNRESTKHYPGRFSFMLRTQKNELLGVLVSRNVR
eukprot:COSAG02_NODE_685_length_18484_cov_49.605330_8_plen_149_part_00